MPKLTPREIREAIRELPEAERQGLIDELIDVELTESAEVLKAVAEGLDQAERGELIDHEDLAEYMARRRKDRKRAQGH